MVNELPSIQILKNLCMKCLIGKQHRDTMTKRSLWRELNKLQLVHADICGSIKPKSNSNKRYFLSFIDDFTRKTHTYFLHEKLEAFTTFKTIKAYVEKESGAYITSLRTDRGGEFTSNEFNFFCKVHGIRRQLTATYTPKQNGLREKIGR